MPEHDVAYISGNGDSRALASIQVNAYAAGGFAIHYRDETTNQPLRFSTYPNLVVNSTNSSLLSVGTSSTNQFTPANTGATGGDWGISHHPSVGYMAYLLLGRFYFLEEIQHAAAIQYLMNTDTLRGLSEGVFRTNVGANTERGHAWAIRTLVQAAAVTPTGEILQTEYLNSWQSNINFYHTTYVAQSNNTQGFVAPYANYNAPNSPVLVSAWMDNFINFAWGYSKDLALGITTGNQTKLDAFYAWKVQSIVGMLGGTASTQYYFGDAGVYTVAAAPLNNSNWVNGTGPWYNDFGEIHAATETYNGVAFPPQDNNLHGTSGSNPLEASTGYWGNLQPAIAYAVSHGATGALASYNRMIGANNWAASAATYNDTPLWSVMPSTLVPTDVTSPTVVITSPTSSPTHPTSVSTITLGGTAADDTAVSAVTWSTDQGFSGVATGTVTWSAPGITLISGANIITVLSHDAAANIPGEDIITVTFTPTMMSPIAVKLSTVPLKFGAGTSWKLGERE
jgi:hypothetical protein